MADENETVKMMQGIKDALRLIKENNELEAIKLSDPDGKKLPEDVYGYTTQRRSRKNVREHETLVRTKDGFSTLAQEHTSQSDHIWDESKQNTFDDFRTSMMVLMGLYFKLNADFSHAFYEFPDCFRELIEDHFYEGKKGIVDKTRLLVDQCATWLEDSNVDYSVMPQDIMPLISYNSRGIQINTDALKSASVEEKKLFSDSLIKVVDAWLIEQGYQKEGKRYVGLKPEDFNSLMTKSETGLDWFMATRLEDISPKRASAPTPNPAPF